jgi:DNA polymerase (family 10)
MMTKEQIAELLENFGRLLELKGENPFKIRAYSNAVRALETLAEPLDKLVAEERLEEIDGIGKAIAEKITTLVQTGSLPQYNELRESFPADILTLFELQGLGAKKIKVIHDTLQISSISSLARACKDGRIAAIPGFGEKTAANILAAIEHRKKNAGSFLLGDVAPVAQRLLDDLRSHPEILHAEIAGSYRRGKEIVHDLDIIAATREPKLVSEDFAGHELVERVLAAGATKTSVILKNGLQCDLRVVSGAEYPFAIQYFTGSKEHNVRLRSRALERGWSLNEYRFSEAEGRKLAEPLPEVREERDIYRALDFDFIAPELREDRGELDAAKEGRLPRLIEWQNLRGTFHNHTTASDGRATLEQMADAARELGLEYLGIADHSKSSVQANGLDIKRLADQREQIDLLNAGDRDFRIFAGTECDILKDGSLDFPDDVLASLDYVVASIHSVFTLSEAEMTSRIIKAISNPYVTMMGHLTGRLLTSREPYKVDVPAIIEAAAATGTIIELNANPRRLDMDWRWWPLAIEKGVKCSINPDAHSTHGLQDLAFGVRIARKGWLTRNDVVNCLPLGEIEAVLQKKRGR